MVVKLTERQLIRKIYSTQAKNSRKRGHGLLGYSAAQLEAWCLSQSIFHTIYKSWVISHYTSKLVPSIDRCNSLLPYVFSNMEIVTWEENNNRSHQDRIDGINSPQSIAVMQFDKEDNFIASYVSLSAAARATGIKKSSNIGLACSGERKTCGGYKWKYK